MDVRFHADFRLLILLDSFLQSERHPAENTTQILTHVADPRYLLPSPRHLWFIARETHLESKHDAPPFLPRPHRNPGQPGPNPRAGRGGGDAVQSRQATPRLA